MSFKTQHMTWVELNGGLMLTLVLGVAIGVAVGVGALVEELGVCGVVEGGLVEVGAPVVAVGTVPGVGGASEGGTVEGEEGPVVAPRGVVVCRPVRREVTPVGGRRPPVSDAAGGLSATAAGRLARGRHVAWPGPQSPGRTE